MTEDPGAGNPTIGPTAGIREEAGLPRATTADAAEGVGVRSPQHLID